MPVLPPSKLKSVYADLRQKIRSGVFKDGDCLPTTQELAKSFECSVGMVSKAITMLVHEGLVEQRRRLGIRVIKSGGEEQSLRLDAFGIIYPSGQHEGMWRTVQGFQNAANEEKRRVVTLSAGADFRREMELINRLVEFDVQGVAIYPLVQSTREHLEFTRLLLDLKYPFVLLDHPPEGMDCASVHLDCFHAGYTMTKHLLEKGVKEAGFFANDSLRTSVRERHRGYLWAMQEAGLAARAENILLEPSMRPDFDAPFDEPRSLARTYLANVSSLEGVVCPNEYLAVALIEEARKIGRKVPENLKVVGIDDFSVAENHGISLTTYHAPFEEIGRRAFEVLTAIHNTNVPVTRENRLRGAIMPRHTA